MRVLIDVIDGVSGIVRLIMGLIALVVLGIGVIFTYSVNSVAPVALERVTEQAIEAQAEAREAQLKARRESEMAKQGWGYGSSDRKSNSASDYAEQNRRTKDGWGTD